MRHNTRRLAMATKVVGSMSDWSGILMDLHRQIHDGSLKKEELQAVLERRNPFGDPPAVVTIAPPQPAVKLTFDQAMEKAYGMLSMEAKHGVFVKEFDCAQTLGKRTLIMLPGLKVSNIITALRAAGSKADTWYSNPDTAAKHNALRPNQEEGYLLDLEMGDDPDPHLAGRSHNDLLKEPNEYQVSNGHITWLERWFLELVHFLMTGVNLDKNGIWTRCDGSLVSGGGVPCVHFFRGLRKVYGDDCGPGSSGADVCGRSAVPRKPRKVGANS